MTAPPTIPERSPANLPHGGDLGEAAALAGRAPWLDLSTGISPHPYPARIDPACLGPLPQRQALDATLAAAQDAYGSGGRAIVAAPGTQAILQWLPIVAPAASVAILGPTYGEHEATWRRAGADVRTVATLDEARAAACVVVVNPNNPDGRLFSRDTLSAFAAERPDRRLIVDEAFCDLAPEASVAGVAGTLVLRSFGKFYGLAGLRLGFAVGDEATVAALGAAMGPWAVSGPALQVGALALADKAWADRARTRLRAERAALDAVLAQNSLAVVGGTDLYRLVESPIAGDLHAALAQAGVWTRRFPEQPDRLRFGLPGAALDAFALTLKQTLAQL